MAFDFSKISPYLRKNLASGRSLGGPLSGFEQQPASQPAPTPESYVASRATPAVPKVGDRLFAQFDSTGRATSTTSRTEYPLYFDPLRRQLTTDRTTIPAIYGMVGTEALNITTPGGQPISGTAGLAEASKAQRDYEFIRGAGQRVPSGARPRPPMTPVALQQHNAYIKQLAGRQQELDVEARSLALQVGQVARGTPEWVELQKRRQSVIMENESIRRRVFEEPTSILTIGPNGEPIPIEFRPSAGVESYFLGGTQSTLVQDMTRWFNWEIRPVHSMIETARAKSAFVDLVGRGVALLAGSPGTSFGLLWSQATAPISFLSSSFSNIPIRGGITIPVPTYAGTEEINLQAPHFSVRPDIDTQEAIGNLVRYGWDRDEAERIVEDLKRGQGLWEDRRAWAVVDIGARLQPFETKLHLLDEAWKATLVEAPTSPLPVRGLGPAYYQQRREEVTNNLRLGQETEDSIAQMKTHLDAIMSLRMTDPTGEQMDAEYQIAYQNATAAWEAVKARTDVPSYAYRYTWVLDDKGKELEDAADKAIVDSIVQLGRLPEPWEIEEITDRFTNPLAELGGDVFLDPLNLIPGVVMERMLVKPIGGLIARASGLIVDAAKMTRPGRWAAKALASESLASAAGRMGHSLVGLLQPVARASDSPTGVVETLQQMLRVIAGDPQALPLGELSRLGVHEWQMDWLNKIVGSLQRGKQVLTQDEAIKELAEIVGGTLTDETKTVDNLFRDLPSRVQDAIINKQRLWENGLVDEGMTAQFAKAVRAHEVVEGVVVHKYWRQFITEVSRLQNRIWGIHIKLLLTARPAFTVWNFVDTMTRALIWGADFDDLESIYRLQSRMGGFLPELVDSWARGAGEIDKLTDPHLVQKILSGEIKPRFGLASVFYEGFKSGGDPFAKWTRGLSLVNAVTEGTWRARLFHSQWLKQFKVARGLLDNALPGLFAKYGVQDSRVLDMLQELYVENNLNGAAFLQAVQETILGRKGVAGIMTPPGVLANLATVSGPEQASQVVGEISRALRQLANDGNFTDESIDALMDAVQKNYREIAAARREAAGPLRGAIGGINTDTKLEPPVFPSAEEMTAKATGEVGQVNVAAQRANLQEEFERLSSRMWDTTISPEELAATRQRIAEIDEILRPSTVADRAAQEVAATVPEHEQVVLEEVRTIDQALADQLRGEILEPGQSEALRVRLHNEATFWAAGKREFAENYASVRVAASQNVQNAAAGLEELNPQLRQAADYMDVLRDGLERDISRFREYTIRGPNGPLRVSQGTDASYVVQRWNQWFIMYGTKWSESANMLREVNELVAKGDFVELARRLEAKEFPSWLELWQKAGFEFDIAEDGTLLSMRYPKTSPIRPIYTRDRRPNILREFLQFNGSSDPWNFNVAFMQEPAVSASAWKELLGTKTDEVVQAAAEGAAIVAPVADDAATLAQAVDARKVPDPDVDEAWRAVVAHPELRLKYPAAKGGFEPFQDWANREINNLRRIGTADALEKARSLEYQLVRARQTYRALLVERGLLDVVEMPLPGINMVDEATRTYQNMAGEANQAEASLDDMIDTWRTYAKEQASTGGWRTATFDEAQGKTALSAAEEMSDLIDRAIVVTQRGSKSVAGLTGWDEAGRFLGTVFDGALPVTNKVMIDYSTQSKFLRTMRNFFPFIRFQLRSMPMWAETVALHPEILAFYFKYMQASKRFAYQRGAIDVTGNARPSLAGYIPIPGTDTWISPIAPISLRYLFPRADYYDDTANETSIFEDVVNYMSQTGQLMGISQHPWMAFVLFGYGILSPGRVNRYPAIPQTKLIPPVITRAFMENLRRMGTWGQATADMIDPEFVASDYLIERRVLVNALNAISDLDRDVDWKRWYVSNIASAVSIDQRYAEGNESALDLWEKARDEIGNEEYSSGLVGYFTGIYGKEFTDADAELERLRREINSLRMTLNDEIGAEVLGLDMNAENRHQYYQDQRFNTPEGYLYGLRSLIGWSRAPDTGRQLFGEERLQNIAMRVRQEQKVQAFYDDALNLRNSLQQGLASLPIGAAGALKEKYFQEYNEGMARLFGDEETRMLINKPNDYIGYKPTSLVYQQARNMWWETIRNTAPVPDFTRPNGYVEWKEKYDAWLAEITSPQNVAFLVRDLEGMFTSLEWADETNRPENMMGLLAVETTPEGFETWKKENDSVLQAIEYVHGRYFLDEYFRGIEGKNVDESTLFKRFFDRKYPEGATDENYIEWIQKEYGDRFSDGQIIAAVHGRPRTTPEERQEQGAGPLKPVLNSIFEELSGIAPGTEYGDFLDAYRSVGGREGDIDVVYNPITGQGTKVIDFPSDKSKEWADDVLAKIREAKRIMGLDNISDAELKDRGDARNLNDTFRASVEQTLGDDFYTLYGYYNGLSLSEQSAFRKSSKEDYARIEEYRKMRDAYAEQNPLWAKYYVEADKKSTSGGGGGGGRAGGGTGAARSRAAVPPGGFASPGLRSTLDARYLAPHNLGRAGTTRAPVWPRWLLEKIGEVMAQEVAALVEDGTVLPPQVEEYLKNLAARNNDARLTIEPTLVLNEKAKVLATPLVRLTNDQTRPS